MKGHRVVPPARVRVAIVNDGGDEIIHTVCDDTVASIKATTLAMIEQLDMITSGDRIITQRVPDDAFPDGRPIL